MLNSEPGPSDGLLDTQNAGGQTANDTKFVYSKVIIPVCKVKVTIFKCLFSVYEIYEK